MRVRFSIIVIGVLVAVLVAPPMAGGWRAWAAPQDPPGRVGRLNYLSGTVSFAPPGVNEWAPAILNYPLTTGDSLWSDEGARAEFHVGSTVIRLDHSTALEILNLDDSTVQLRLSQGTINVDLHEIAAGERFEVDTPEAAVSLLQPGTYRVDVAPDGTWAQVRVSAGEGDITASPYDFHVYPGQAAVILSTANTLGYDIRPAPTADAFDRWAATRERQEQIALAQARYVPPAMTGFEDLTQFGTWQIVPGWGPVWIPAVQAGWAPFRFGRWVWVQPWGWTWVAAEPWGFAPFHFGRWVLLDGTWAWVPGVVVVRPVFAPALVVFVVIGDFVGWFPLAPDEEFVPSFACSSTFVQRININITHVTVINEIRARNVFVFQQVPDAVTFVHRHAFTDADPVIHSRPADAGPAIGRAHVVGTAAPVAPTVRSVLGRVARPSVVAAPPAVVAQRAVVVRQTPPPAPVPFIVQEKFLRTNSGRPLDPATMARLRNQLLASRPLVLPGATPGPREPVAAPHPTSTAPPVSTSPGLRQEPVPAPQPVPMPYPTRPKPTRPQEPSPSPGPAPGASLPVPPPVPKPQPVPAPHAVPAPPPGLVPQPVPAAHASAPPSPPHEPQGRPARTPSTPRRTVNCDPHSKDYDRSQCPKVVPPPTH